MLSDSPVPLYFQIATQLEARINSGEFGIGGYIPSEKQLASEFEVSLITVRAATRILVDKGLIERHPGKGTVVLRKSANTVWELGWLNELITSVLPSSLHLLSMGTVKPPAWVVARLGIGPDSQVHAMRTVRLAPQKPNEPFMTTDLYHPLDIGTKLKKSAFKSREAQSKLVINTVEEKCGVSVASVRQTMTAALADNDASCLLGIDPGHPLLVVSRDYFDATGRLVQVGNSRYRTDHYEYVLNLSRNPSRSPKSKKMVRALFQPDA